MKYVFQDDNGKLHNVEAPDGTDIAYIEREASKQLGLHVRHVDPAALAKADQKPAAAASEHIQREIERGNEALKREIDKADRLRTKIEKLESEVVAADRRTLDAKAARGEALTEAKNAAAKLYACEQTLEQERKARAKAEATTARLREEAAKVQSAPEPRQLIAFRLEEVERDSNGLMKAAVFVPQYAKVTVQ